MSKLLVKYQDYGIDNPDNKNDGEWRFLEFNGIEWEVKMVGSMRKIIRKILKVAGITPEKVE